jgi:serine/threonine protein kinase
MSSRNELHASPAKLNAFGLGLLDAEAAKPIEEHVLGCDLCCQALLAAADDVLDRLRQVARSAIQGTAPGEVGPSSPAAAPGESLPEALEGHPRYRLLRLLGRGGMGAVYLAEHRVMNRLVAVKVHDHDCLASATAVGRFRREARCAARLRHPNIVTVYDADHSGDTCLLVMEFVEGIDLDRLLHERGPLPIALACDYVRQAALGLQHTHERGMVHRDVKPANLMLRQDGVVQVIDFGLVGLAGDALAGSSCVPGPAVPTRESRLTRTSSVMGTPGYLAPEQAAGARAADARSDVYALGCTLHELLTGRVPSRAGRAEGDNPAPVIPVSLDAVLKRMLAPTPGERFQTAGAVAAALAPFAAGRDAPRRTKRGRKVTSGGPCRSAGMKNPKILSGS